MSRGRFITIEGGEGAGKSTQAARLGDHLRGREHRVLVTREPGGTPAADQIRALLTTGETGRWLPLTECLLHHAARVEHVVQVVTPALEHGVWVVSDRFADSTVAYQGYGHGLGADLVRELHAAVVGDLWPDLTIILDLPVEDGLRRAARRRHGGDRYERMDEAFHGRVREGYLKIAASAPERCVLIDARADADGVAGAIRDLVDARLSA